MTPGSAIVLRGDARRLPLPDDSVDLIVTSPPYFALRSYTDDGGHYHGQIGSEDNWQGWLDALLACTAEWSRVLKPSGSIFVNLGDKYAGTGGGGAGSSDGYTGRGPRPMRLASEVPSKSLMLLPERYRIACVDRLGLIARAVICWSKPNGLPESVTDRVRRSHEDWVHLTKRPRYYSAVDEIRQPHAREYVTVRSNGRQPNEVSIARGGERGRQDNPLGALPGSVWTIPTEPLTVPDHLGVDHFACVDEDTEILTTRGWLRHTDLRPDDTVAGYDLDAGLARWTACRAVHRYDYNGDLVAVEKRDLSMRLTPNHRTIAAKSTGRSRHIGPLRIVDGDSLTAQHYIPRAAEWLGFGEKSIGEPLAALLGWVAAEGWITQSGLVALSQSLTVNAEHVETIDRLVDALPPFPADRTGIEKLRRAAVNGSRYERTRIYRGEPWRDVTWVLPLGASQEIRRLMPDKLLGWWVMDLPESERMALLEAFIGGDGHRRADGRVAVFQKLRQNLDVLQAVAVTFGYRTSLREGAGRFVLYMNRGLRPITLRVTNGRNAPIPREHYRGVVWCPTTGTGTFIARRRGSVFITGNSFPTEWPRRLILGWSPPGICTGCGEGRRPVVDIGPEKDGIERGKHPSAHRTASPQRSANGGLGLRERTVTGYDCACPTADAPTTPAVVLDPFGGTGTTAMVARALGRIGISIDLSHDYSRLARWRVFDSGHAAKAVGRFWQERQQTLDLGGATA